jgi:uncharacterized protein YcbX
LADFHGHLAPARGFVNKAQMATVDSIYRYPVKGLSPEPLTRAQLEPGAFFPGDRLFAIENGPSGFDSTDPQRPAKIRFLMLMRDERLATLRTRYEDATGTLSIEHEGRSAVRADLATSEGRLAIEAFFRRFMPAELRGPPKVLAAPPGFRFTDSRSGFVSIINLASVAAIESIVGVPVQPLRFRANLYVDGWPAWHEFELVGREITIGGVRLKIIKRIERCAAINVDPGTGMRDLGVLTTLMRTFDHADCGVYAQVIAGGDIAPGEKVLVLDSPVRESGSGDSP